MSLEDSFGSERAYYFDELSKRAGYLEVIQFADMFTEAELEGLSIKNNPSGYIEEIRLRVSGRNRDYVSFGKFNENSLVMKGLVLPGEQLQRKVIEDLYFVPSFRSPFHLSTLEQIGRFYGIWNRWLNMSFHLQTRTSYDDAAINALIKEAKAYS